MSQQNSNQNEINYARMMAKVYNWLREYQGNPNEGRDWMIFNVALGGGIYLFSGHGDKIGSPKTKFSVAIVFFQQSHRNLKIYFQIDEKYSFFKQISFRLKWGKNGNPNENRNHPDEIIAGLGKKFGFVCNKSDGELCQESMIVKEFTNASDDEVKKTLFTFLDKNAEAFKSFQEKGYGMNRTITENKIKERIQSMSNKGLIVAQNGVLSVPDSADYVTSLEGGKKSDSDEATEETDECNGDDMLNEIRKLLESSHQVILTGAPGTGKTYLAKKVALAMLGEQYTDKDWDKAFWDGRVGFCQFHPSYDYSDFVEGLRPVTVGKDVNAQVGFKRMDGVFKKFCKQAANDKGNNKYVFVIDEINRGDISKIFGELFFSIDPGYRGMDGRVNTQYQNLVTKTERYTVQENGKEVEKERDDVFYGGFYVPENVYIIGTMNDIDRSVESMDFAIRRRFVWQEVEPNLAALDAKKEGKNETGESCYIIAKKEDRDDAKERMKNLNEKICESSLLGPAYAIGQAYFLKLDSVGGFDNLWKMNLEPLLREYLRGNPKNEIDKTIEEFKNAYTK